MRVVSDAGWHGDPHVRQFVKYGVVGASNTVLTFVVFSIFVTLGLHEAIALVIGYGAGSLNSYFFNRHWTFRAHDVAHRTAGSRFAVVQAGAIAVNEVALYIFVHHLGVGKIPSQAILTLPVLAITFFLNRWWSFASPGEPPAAS